MVVEESERERVIQMLKVKYDNEKVERVRELLEFFLEHKTLINKFIHYNLSAIDQQFQSLVVLIPEIFEFDSKRLLWRACIRRHVKKQIRDSDDYDVELGVRREMVFADSFEQLKELSSK
jgi:hypothetical protein